MTRAPLHISLRVIGVRPDLYSVGTEASRLAVEGHLTEDIALRTDDVHHIQGPCLASLRLQACAYNHDCFLMQNQHACLQAGCHALQ